MTSLYTTPSLSMDLMANQIMPLSNLILYESDIDLTPAELELSDPDTNLPYDEKEE